MTDRPDAPGPMRRMGPRPFMLHLMLTATNGPNAKGPSRPIPDAAFLAGVAAYRRHPYQRTVPDPPVIWSEGESRLLDYGGPREGHQGGSFPLVLVVPSLINRAYVLDLAPERSMLRTMAGQGCHPVLLDWGWPGPAERRFGLDDYIAGRLERALASLPGPVVLLGYCMGGLLALALALRRPERLRALVLLATPWDFHAGRAPAHQHAATLGQQAAVLPPGSAIPIDAIQTMFAMADPDGVASKYRGFAHLDPASERARMFVALEDWLADGVPLAAPTAAECFGHWYGENRPARTAWMVAGAAVDPAKLAMPTLIALPARDRIVPPQSAAALARAIPHATVLHPAAGHVGMVAGATAAEQLWRPAMDWLRAV